MASHIVDGFDDLDTAALAAPSGMDLRLDDPDRAAQFRGHLYRVVHRVSNTTLGYGDTVFGKQALGLIFVNIHFSPAVVPKIQYSRVIKISYPR